MSNSGFSVLCLILTNFPAYSFGDICMAEVVSFTRERPPADYLLKIESFSKLQKSLQDVVFESTEFTAGGYTWFVDESVVVLKCSY